MSNMDYYLLEKEGENSKCGMLDLGKCMDSDENSTGENVFATSTSSVEVPPPYPGNGKLQEDDTRKEDESANSETNKLQERGQVVGSSEDQIMRFITASPDEGSSEVTENRDAQIEKDTRSCESTDSMLKDIIDMNVGVSIHEESKQPVDESAVTVGRVDKKNELEEPSLDLDHTTSYATTDEESTKSNISNEVADDIKKTKSLDEILDHFCDENSDVITSQGSSYSDTSNTEDKELPVVPGNIPERKKQTFEDNEVGVLGKGADVEPGKVYHAENFQQGKEGDEEEIQEGKETDPEGNIKETDLKESVPEARETDHGEHVQGSKEMLHEENIQVTEEADRRENLQEEEMVRVGYDQQVEEMGDVDRDVGYDQQVEEMGDVDRETKSHGADDSEESEVEEVDTGNIDVGEEVMALHGSSGEEIESEEVYAEDEAKCFKDKGNNVEVRPMNVLERSDDRMNKKRNLADSGESIRKKCKTLIDEENSEDIDNDLEETEVLKETRRKDMEDQEEQLKSSKGIVEKPKESSIVKDSTVSPSNAKLGADAVNGLEHHKEAESSALMLKAAPGGDAETSENSSSEFQDQGMTKQSQTTGKEVDDLEYSEESIEKEGSTKKHSTFSEADVSSAEEEIFKGTSKKVVKGKRQKQAKEADESPRKVETSSAKVNTKAKGRENDDDPYIDFDEESIENISRTIRSFSNEKAALKKQEKRTGSNSQREDSSPSKRVIMVKTAPNVEKVKRKLEEILEKSKGEEDAAIAELQRMKKEKTDILNAITTEMEKLKSMLVKEKQG